MSQRLLLHRLQRLIERQNGAPPGPHINQFVLTEAEQLEELGLPVAAGAVEQVFVSQDADAPEMSVFIETKTLELAAKNPPTLDDTQHLDAYCVATEAVSHFVLLAHRAALDGDVSLLELELQAEVDKFVHLSNALRLEPNSRGASLLFERLFERYSLRPHVTGEERERYQNASHWAARFCLSLQRANNARQQVRKFFASSLAGKLEKLTGSS